MQKLCGRVLYAGCGTGEHVLMAAGMGLPAIGIDVAPSAIAIANEKARQRKLHAANFLVGDALHLPSLGESFDTVLDCGLFHVFDDRERALFARELALAVAPGGRYFMLCFSDRQPGNRGPRRVRQAEIRAVFNTGWKIESIEPSVIECKGGPKKAWLAEITKST
jgi:ubiquinone/menaquinone biosynthesis C-methylase UbiE